MSYDPSIVNIFCELYTVRPYGSHNGFDQIARRRPYPVRWPGHVWKCDISILP